MDKPISPDPYRYTTADGFVCEIPWSWDDEAQCWEIALPPEIPPEEYQRIAEEGRRSFIKNVALDACYYVGLPVVLAIALCTAFYVIYVM